MEAKKEPTSLFVRKRVLVQVEIECDEELFPGWGYDPHDFAEAAAKAAAGVLVAYNPKVITTGWGPADRVPL